MTVGELFTFAALGLSGVNTVILVITFRRAERWKESDDAKELIRRVGAVENDVQGVKARMENVATKADVARLTAEISGFERHMTQQFQGVDQGVQRIESYLINKSRD